MLPMSLQQSFFIQKSSFYRVRNGASELNSRCSWNHTRFACIDAFYWLIFIFRCVCVCVFHVYAANSTKRLIDVLLPLLLLAAVVVVDVVVAKQH